MRVLVTGPNGFVGLNIVEALTSDGHEVLAYVRPTSNVTYLERFEPHLISGELSDYDRLVDALADADAIIHSAGNTSSYEKDLPVLRAVNVEGTRTVVRAAVSAGVRRLVYTSTTSTIGADSDANRRWAEGEELRGFRATNPYGRTKLEAEHIVLGAREDGLEPVILNPAEVVGAWDHTRQWGTMVLAVCGDQVPFLPPGSASFCYAAAVGRAHVRALTAGRPGERYILAGTDSRFTDFIDCIAEVTGSSYSVDERPYEWHYERALEQERRYPIDGTLPLVDPYRMRVFAGHYLFDCSKAERELDFEVLPLETMVREAYEWYRTNGFLD